jgi:tRNA modification GTPase
MLADRHDPIVAVATASGKGAIGVVRVSATGLLGLAQRLLGREPQARHATLMHLRDGADQPIDQVLMLWFPAPHSYTGEDVLELQGHGGPWVMQRTMAHLMAVSQEMGRPMRLARPGEFTERAFLNHKLDLAQAEAIADLIDASTEQAARSAARSLTSGLSQAVHGLRADLIHLRMWVEASLDFPEEDIDFLQQSQALAKHQALVAQTQQLLFQARQGALLREGIRLVILGQPNAGKSALLNALSGRERAIVTDVPGTTRDVLEESLSFKGVPVHLIDTAGLRQDTQDVVEQIGMQRTWEQVDQADAIIWLRDASKAADPQALQADERITRQLQERLSRPIPTLEVWNKQDLAQSFKPSHGLLISAKERRGLDELVDQVLHTVGWEAAQQEGVFMARERHVRALQLVQDHLMQAGEVLQDQALPLELLAEALRQTQLALDGITGTFSADDLLGEIFAGFCIGK